MGGSLLIKLYTFLAIFLGFLLDFVLGDPQNPFHPIRFIGNMINFGDNIYKRSKIRNPILSFILGVVLTLFVIAISYGTSFFIIKVFYKIHMVLGFILEVILSYFLFAQRALKDESMKVYYALNEGNIELARKNLSFIVGRDTKSLSKNSIIKAAVETVSENLSDGVIAPLFFMLVFGIPFGFLYKAVNTLDSMIGYKNEIYEYFGKFAARLDDILNLFPSRLASLFMILSSWILGFNFKGAINIYKRDRYKHKSPNSAHTESVCAGALNIMLGGDNYYGGILVNKPTIGDNLREADILDIKSANKMMYLTSILVFAFLSLIYFGVLYYV